MLTWSGKDGKTASADMLVKLFSEATGKLEISKISLTRKFLLPFGMCSVAHALPDQVEKDGMYKSSLYLEVRDEDKIHSVGIKTNPLHPVTIFIWSYGHGPK